MLNEFLFWWWRQLRSLLPATFRGSAAHRAAPRLLLAPGLDSLEVPDRVRTSPARSFPLDPSGLASLRAALPGPAELELPPHRMLAQEVTLPLAAERDLGGVLHYEMDRLTPFPADDLHWSWRLLRRDRTAGTVTLRLLVVPRASLRPVLDALAGAGLRLSALRAGADTIPLGIPPGRGSERALRTGLLAGCVLLALAAAALPFVGQSLESARLERRIAAARPATVEAEALRRSAQATTAGTDVLAVQRGQSGSVLLMLAALTAGLGDGTHLTDLSFRARVATASGASDAAVRLIPALTAQPALSNTSFTAPVTRIDASGRQGFALRTELAP